MKHATVAGIVLSFVLGCQAPAEKLPIKPLPEDGQQSTYFDLLQRARSQASAANEAFYTDSWAELEESARGLEQTARHLTSATEVPAPLKATLTAKSDDLGKQAVQLREAARAHDVKQTTQLMQALLLRVRELRGDR